MKPSEVESLLIDIIDLMVDEFRRIRALHHLDPETISLCDRAIGSARQNVPVIVQRDKAEADHAEALRVVQRCVNALNGCIETEDYAVEEALSYAKAIGIEPTNKP